MLAGAIPAQPAQPGNSLGFSSVSTVGREGREHGSEMESVLPQCVARALGSW